MFGVQSNATIGFLGIRFTFKLASRPVLIYFTTRQGNGSINVILKSGNAEQCKQLKLDLYNVTIICIYRFAELAAVVVATLIGMPGGCLLFVLLYHPLHDYLGVHSEVTACIVLFTFAAIVWKYDRRSGRSDVPKELVFNCLYSFN